MRASDFDYILPPELIAQAPLPQRDQSRLLVIDRSSGVRRHELFSNLPDHLRRGDLLVLNDSRVIRARLRGVNPRTGGKFEILLLREVSTNDWWVLLRPGKRGQPGTRIGLLDPEGRPAGIEAVVLEVNSEGHRRLQFQGTENMAHNLDTLGEVPLPPYIARPRPELADADRYQTVYADAAGSVAAPTAGLHFTEALLDRIRSGGVEVCTVTLHVGLGTFAPVKADLLEQHVLHEEQFEISPQTAAAVTAAKAEGRRVVAVGTTTVRVLESVAAAHGGRIGPGRGTTRIFIHPPFSFSVVDALVTNFHLPRSTLLMLVSALAGREAILGAYAEAIDRRYRFFSYGDAMFIQ
jgi:S-adenosylmethionine:tRNA ribosyltransferase-isomerase